MGSVNARICNTTRRLQATNLVCGAPTASIPRICPPLVISLPLPRTENHAFFLARWFFFWMGAFKTPRTSTIGDLIVLCAYVRTWHCRPSFLIHLRFLLSYWHLTCTPAVWSNLQYPHCSSLQWLDEAGASRMALWRHGLI